MLCAAIIAGLVVALPAVTRAFPGNDGKIVFAGPISSGSFKAAIYTINPNGSELTKLLEVTAAPDAVDPTWSPDASEIAFSSPPLDNPTGDSAIYALNVGTGDVRLLATEVGFDFTQPAWSPSGDQITFTGRWKTNGEYRIWIAPTDGSDGDHHISPQPILGGSPVFALSGISSIIYSDAAGSSGPADLFSINPDGTNLTRLTNTDSASELQPAPSPDGSKLATAFSGPGFVKIYISDGTTNDAFSQGPDTRADLSPTWSPTGTRLAYQGGATDPQLIIRSLSGGAEQVIDTQGLAYDPDWGVGAEPEPSPSPSPSSCPSWPVGAVPPPTDGLIVFTGRGSQGSSPLYTMDPDEGPRGELLRSASESNKGTSPEWSPNGSQIVYQEYGGDNSTELYLIRNDGEGRRRLLRRINGDYDATWSPDGRYVAFVRSDKEHVTGRIYRMNADGSELTAISKAIQGGNLAWSPDGQRIAYSDKGDLWTIRPDGCGSPVQVTKSSAVETQPDWHPTEPLLAFTRKSGSETKIYTINLNNTTLTKFTHGNRVDTNPSWSPLGNRMAFIGGGDLMVVASDGRGEKVVSDGGAGYRLPIGPLDWGSFVSAEGPPETSIDDAPPPSPAWESSTVFFSYSSSKPDSSFQCKLEYTDFEPCEADGRYFFDVPNGKHTFSVFAIDALGNADPTPATWNFSVKDTVAPNTFISAAPPVGEVVHEDSVTIDFASNKPNSTFACTLDGETKLCVGSTQGAGTNGSVTLDSLANGPHTFSIAASDALGNVDPTPATTSFTVEVFRCEDQPLQLPSFNIELDAECLKKELIDKTLVYAAEHLIKFNGLTIEAPKIYFDPQRLRLWSERGFTVWLGEVGAGLKVLEAPNGQLDWNLNFPQLNLPTLPGVSLEGFPIQGNIKVTRGPGFSAVVEMWAKLPQLMGDVTGQMTVTADNGSGLVLSDARIELPSFKLGGFLEFAGLPGEPSAFIEYKGNGDWEGAARVVLPGGYGAHGSVIVKNGQLNGGDITTELGQGIPLTAGVFLDELGARVVVGPPFELGGSMAIGVGPKISNVRAVKISGQLVFTFPFEDEPGEFAIEGELFLVGRRVASGFVHYFTDGTVLFGASADFRFPDNDEWRARFEAELEGWVSKSKFSAKQHGVFEWRERNFFTGQWETKFLTEVTVVASSKGLAGCLKLVANLGPLHGEADVGGSYDWTTGEIKFGGCSIGLFELKPPARAAVPRSILSAERMLAPMSPEQTFTVAPNQNIVAFSFEGETGPPEVVLTGPDGRVISTPDDPTDEGPANGHFILRDAVAKTTYIAVVAPAAGEWVATLKEGSSPLVAIQQAAGLPDPEIEATVSGSGFARTLNYEVKPIPGQTVTFIEEGEGTDHVLGEATKAKGKLEFTPAYSSESARKIVALVEQNDAPRASLEVATFEAPPLPELAKPGSLKVRRAKALVKIDWNPVTGPGIKGYEVELTQSDGRAELFITDAANSALEVAGVGRAGATVSVRAVDDLDRLGPAASAELTPIYGASNGSGSITLTFKRVKKQLKASGMLFPPTPGAKITVTLTRKDGGAYARVASKTITLGDATDRNGDGIPESRYATSFRRPAGGTCRLRAFSPGNEVSLPLAVTKTFKC